jgi:hypothetical protein
VNDQVFLRIPRFEPTWASLEPNGRGREKFGPDPRKRGFRGPGPNALETAQAGRHRAPRPVGTTTLLTGGMPAPDERKKRPGCAAGVRWGNAGSAFASVHPFEPLSRLIPSTPIAIARRVALTGISSQCWRRSSAGIRITEDPPISQVFLRQMAGGSIRRQDRARKRETRVLRATRRGGRPAPKR